MSEKVNIGGINVEVVSGDEAERAKAVVCMPVGPSDFDDNVETDCFDCGRRIMHRPNAPVKPVKICIFCMQKWVQAGSS